MRNVAVLVGAVAIAVFATAAVTGNAGVNKNAATTPSLQKQINELRNELICLDTVAGDGVAAVGYQAQTGTPKQETAVNDRGVCKHLGVVTQGTLPVPNNEIPPFVQLARRAFGG